MKKILITGSNGLIGYELSKFFSKKKNFVIGIDNNFRKKFFGNSGDTSAIKKKLIKNFKNYIHFNVDIRNKKKIEKIFKYYRPDAIIHCAAQPSHDYASKIPFDNFEINANATLNLLEFTKKYCLKSPFIFLSTNKVYGDLPNKSRIIEKKTRYEFLNKTDQKGINEKFSIDQSLHSLFGVSKVASDLMVQEYAKYYGMYTCCLRGGCLTGPDQSGVELHGFLNYLIKCNVNKKTYKIFGYKGKQVRDNIHSYDVAKFIDHFLTKPRKGEVYNLGGGKSNSISIIEAINKIEKLSGIKMKTIYYKKNRIGDHVCYYSDLTKMKKHYPKWKITKNLDIIFKEIYQNWVGKKN